MPGGGADATDHVRRRGGESWTSKDTRYGSALEMEVDCMIMSWSSISRPTATAKFPDNLHACMLAAKCYSCLHIILELHT